MKLILKEAITHLGEPGDLVEVKPGYARNYLLPQGLAIQATPANIKAIEHELKKLRAFAAEKRERARAIAAKLAEVTLTMERKVADPDNGTLYGSVNVADIGDALEALGYEIPKGDIHLDHPIKQIGRYEVAISLAHGVRGAVKVNVVPEGGELPQPEHVVAAQAEDGAAGADDQAAASSADGEESVQEG